VANGTFTQPINSTVLDHSAGEFVNPTAPHTLTLDFGTLMQNSGTASEPFQITNLSGLYRAGLDLNSFAESGDFANRFSTDLSLFSALAAGMTTSPFQVFLATDQLGSFSASYLLNVADQSGIYGGTGEQLEIDVLGSVVVPEPSTFALAALAIGTFAALRLRGTRRRSG
jgi:hypothetical protein